MENKDKKEFWCYPIKLFFYSQIEAWYKDNENK